MNKALLSVKSIGNIRFSIKSIKIRTRILGLFLIIISAAVTIVAGVTYTIGKSNLENMTIHQLDNSVHSIVNQISLLTSAYSSREFSGKLNYVLSSEAASYKQAGYDAGIYLLKSDGTVVDRTDVSKGTGKKSDLPDSLIKLALKDKKGTTEIKLNGQEVSAAFGYIVEKDWIYIVAVKKASYLKLLYKLQIATVISGLICILLAFLLSMLGTRGIVESIRKLNNTVTSAGKGTLSIRSSADRGGPEIINLSNSLNGMLSNIQRLLGEIGASIEELTASSTELNEISKKTDDSTYYIYSLTQKMSENSAEQNSFAVQMGTSANTLIETIEKVAQKVNLTADLSELMINSACEGMRTLKELNSFIAEIEEVTDKTVEFVNILEKRSTEINKVTSTIKNISGQTKLLSLNASIEAARAGEAGQGFMVVAHEIQELAFNSARSAIEVEEIVKDIRDNTEAALKVAEYGKAVSQKGLAMADTTDKAFSEILDKVSQTHENVKDISSKAENISEHIRLFETNSDKMLDIINQMTAGSQEVASEVEKHHSISGGVITNAKNILNVATKFGELRKSFTTE